MSEPIPESIPTSHRGPPPRKKPRTNLHPSASAAASQANEIENLLYSTADGAIPLNLPESSATQKGDSNGNKAGNMPPPEIVPNVQGSSAGAGSGEFHVYKASRRREYERMRAMEEEGRREEGDVKWEEKRRRKEEEDEERVRRNREKRKRKKGKGDKKGGGGGRGAGKEGDAVGENGVEDGNRKERGKGKREVNGLPSDEDEDENNAEPEENSMSNGTSMGIAQILKEAGITIHEDN